MSAARKRVSLATVVTARQVAEMLGHTHDENGHQLSKEAMTRWGRRWLQRRGIARQAKKGCHWYTTVALIGTLDDNSILAELYRRG